MQNETGIQATDRATWPKFKDDPYGYAKEYRKANPEKWVQYRINSARRLLERYGYTTTKNGKDT